MPFEKTSHSIDFSIVIPTWNRSSLVDALLESLSAARDAYIYGKSEIIIIDSSTDNEQAAIQASCQNHGARYISGPDSVRKKRNMGIERAVFDYILFLDSDVRVDEQIMNRHAEAYLSETTKEHLGGTFGITEFVGPENLVWKIVQYTTFTDSFSFARWFPYQKWTLGNNVTFLRQVLLDINMFEEAFPYKLGGDDLDLSYRVNKAGYQIKSVPNAVTWHTKETWSNFSAINDRSKRWGSMEYYLSCRHPEIFIHGGVKAEWFLATELALFSLGATVVHQPKLMKAGLFTAGLTCASIYWLDTHKTKKKNPMFYFAGKYFHARYAWYHALEGLKHHTFDGFYKTMSFSNEQTKHILYRESQKMWLMAASLVLGSMAAFLSE